MGKPENYKFLDETRHRSRGIILDFLEDTKQRACESGAPPEDMEAILAVSLAQLSDTISLTLFALRGATPAKGMNNAVAVANKG